MGEILVGTASWTDKSLTSSGWYPPGTSSSEERLKYYASQYPLVEVDATYYFPPTKENSQRWADRSPKDFTFNIKAFSLLTQHPTKPNALPKDLQQPTDKRMLYPKDIDDKVVEEVWHRFLDALEPLVEVDKLGAILFQFPPWFTISKANKAYVLECATRIAPLRPCIEFRNKTWMSEDNQKETLEFLTGHDLPYVAVDMPQGFPSSIPPIVEATSDDLAVVRFHGHNNAEWESKDVQKRFAYLYSDKELEEWAPKIIDLSHNAATVHILMNNCHSDYAQRNATTLATLLDADD